MTAGLEALFDASSEAEVIGAAMYAPDQCEIAFERLSPADFGDPVLGRIWEQLAALARAGSATVPAILRDRMGPDPGFEDWGGFDGLCRLFNDAAPGSIASHVEAVADRAGRRAILALAEQVGAAALDLSSGGHAEILATMERGAQEIASRGLTADRFMDAGAMVSAALEHARSRKGLIEYPFGLPSLDRFTAGMNAGEMTLLAARPAVGKTVGALMVARANASARRGVCFFSLEMAENPLGLRMACDVAFDRYAPAFSGVTSNPTPDKAMKGELSPDGWARLDEAQRVIDGWPLKVDTRPGLTMAQIEAAARRQHRRWARQGIKPGPVIIDHLGKVRPQKDRKGSKHAEMADISNDGAQMAKNLGVPVLALVQLNRGVEGRDDKTPQLSDLRQAGELEEDARQVIFLSRPEYYLREGPPTESFETKTARLEKLEACRNHLYWVVDKNSHGPRGQVKTFCEIGCSAVREWDHA